MSTSNRKIIQSPLYQGKDEKIAYELTTTKWGSAPTGVVVKIFDNTDADVSSTKLSGSASVFGDIITTPAVQELEVDITYRLEILFVISGNVFEPFCYIIGEK